MDWGAVALWTAAIAGAGAAAYQRWVAQGVWRNVAEGRGERIDDLEQKVSDLETHIARLETRMNVLTKDFAGQIANEVVIKIKAME